VIGAAFTITAKDLKERFRDRSAIMLAIVVPLGLAFVMNLTIGPLADQSFNTGVTVHDADGGAIATGFDEMLADVETAGFVDVNDVTTEAEARRLVDDHSVSTAYLLPEGLSDAVAANEEAAIIVVADPDQPIGSQVGTALADGFVWEVNAVRLSIGTALALGGDDLEALIVAAGDEPSPISLASATTEGRGFDFSTFYATGIAVFFMFFTVQFGVLSIIDERENGTMPRLLVAPISRQSILVGKLVASFLVGMASTIVLWLATTLLMGAEWGGSLIVILLIAAGVTAAMGLTAAIATFAKNAEQAGAITAFVVVVFGVLGGTFFPVSRISGAFAAISRVTPHFWLMEGFQRSSAGEGIVDILPAIGAILAFAIVLGSIGLFRARDLVRHQ